MDILLSSFINSVINTLSFIELLKLEEFLNIEDEKIYNFYLNNIPISTFNDQKILALFKNFKI